MASQCASTICEEDKTQERNRRIGKLQVSWLDLEGGEGVLAHTQRKRQPTQKDLGHQSSRAQPQSRRTLKVRKQT